jgi:hypothetical protein
VKKHCQHCLVQGMNDKFKSPVKNEAEIEDMKTVVYLLKNCWNSVHIFCGTMCDVHRWVGTHEVDNYGQPGTSANHRSEY